MKYTSELHERVRQNLRMFDYPRFDDGDIDALLDEIEHLNAELARLTAELAELNDKAVFIHLENEDELPADISNDVYSTMFNCSHVDGVRLFPYIEENGQKYFLVMLREDE